MSETNSKLPSGWVLARLGDLVRIIRGVTYSKSDAQDTAGPGLIPILRATNIKQDLVFDDLVYVPQSYVKAEQLLQPGDIVVAASSGSRRVVGKAAPLKNNWIGSFGAFCFALRPAGEISRSYLAFFLQTEDYRQRISRLSAGVNINNIKVEHIAETRIPLAPRREQERIVQEIEKQFTRLDAAAEILRHARTALERYRAAVLKAACEGRLLPTEAELARAEGRGYETAEQLLNRISVNPEATVEPLPEGWARTRLGLISRIKGGITKGKKRNPDDVLRQVPYLRVANVQRGHLSLLDIKTIEATEGEVEELRLLPGDVLFTEGGDRDKLGRGWIWNNEIAECIHQNHIFRARLNTTEVSPKYLSWYSNSLGQRYFEQAGKQTTNLASINATVLKNLPVPIPPANEQRRIVAELDRRLSLLEALASSVEANLKRAEGLRSSVLRVSFEGKLVSQDPNDESAAALMERIRGTRSTEASPVRTNRSPPEPPTQPEDTEPQPRTEAAATEPDSERSPFVEHDPAEQTELAWEILFGRGLFEKEAAVRAIAEDLRNQGLAHFQRLRKDGPLFNDIASAIDRGVRQGFFDRPKRGHVRAILADPKAYSPADWRLCLLGALDGEPVEEKDALRAAAEWARETLGLEFARLREDGVILRGLRAALAEAVGRGEVVRVGRGRIRRVG